MIEEELAKLINDYLKSVNQPDYSPNWSDVLYKLNRLRSKDKYEKQSGSLDEDMKHELYACMTTKYLRIRPEYVNNPRTKACGRLVKQGYLIPYKEKDNPDFKPNEHQAVGSISYTITQKGFDWIMQLNPDDYQYQAFFPRPDDIRHWHKIIKEMTDGTRE